eukprot:1729495-Rhodomonas_salina.1
MEIALVLAFGLACSAVGPYLDPDPCHLEPRPLPGHLGTPQPPCQDQASQTTLGYHSRQSPGEVRGVGQALRTVIIEVSFGGREVNAKDA